jgi:hypothetical protein
MTRKLILPPVPRKPQPPSPLRRNLHHRVRRLLIWRALQRTRIRQRRLGHRTRLRHRHSRHVWQRRRSDLHLEFPAVRWTELQNWQQLEFGYEQLRADFEYLPAAVDEQE